MQTAQPRVACIGGVDIDHKARLHRSFQAGTSNPVSVTSSPGGVIRNIAESLARLQCEVSLFSIVGSDSAGDNLLQSLKRLHVDISGVGRSTRQPTASYTAILEPDGGLAAGLADMAVFDEMTPSWIEQIESSLALCGMWIIDSNLPAGAIEHLLLNSKTEEIKVLGDPVSVAKSERFKRVLHKIDILFPDQREAAALSGLEIKTSEDVAMAAAKIRELGVGSVVVTLGAKGIYLDSPVKKAFYPALPPAEIQDVTGAGDALLAGYAYGLLKDQKTDPVRLGLAAASLALESGQSVPTSLTHSALQRRLTQ